MNAITGVTMLLLVPAVPLLLAIPTLRRHLPWPVLLALLPGSVLLFIPESMSFELPWLLLGGSGLAVDELTRWWLAMSIVAWGAASIILYSQGSEDNDQGISMTWFLLSMAGQLGTVLAADAVSFFAFSSFMGYAFFGLLLFSATAEVQGAGRVYLVFLVIADIILFEALLIAHTSSGDLGFASLAANTANPAVTNLTMALALCGFALKAGFWPVHLWLPNAIASSRPAINLCIWISPVATGLLGILRWTTLRETTSFPEALLLQVLGASAILYATIYGLSRARDQQGMAYIIIAVTGVATLSIGTGLVYPEWWISYAGLLPVLLFGVSLYLTILTLARDNPGHTQTSTTLANAASPSCWYDQWTKAFILWSRHQGLVNLPELRTAIQVFWGKTLQMQKWQNGLDAGERYLGTWTLAILLAVILSILLVVIGFYSSSA